MFDYTYVLFVAMSTPIVMAMATVIPTVTEPAVVVAVVVVAVAVAVAVAVVVTELVQQVFVANLDLPLILPVGGPFHPHPSLYPSSIKYKGFY